MTIPTKCARTFTYHGNTVNALTVLPDQRIASGSHDTTVCIKNVYTDEPPEVLDNRGYGVLALTSIPSTPEKPLLGVGGTEMVTWVFDVTKKERLYGLGKHGSFVTALGALSNGHIVSGSWDRTVKVWNPSHTYPLERTFVQHAAAIYSLSVLPYGGYIVSGGADWNAKVWEADTGRVLNNLPHRGNVRAIAVHPKGETLLTGADSGEISWWISMTHMSKSPLLYTFQAASPVTALTFLSDRETFASGHPNGEINLWNLRTKEFLSALPNEHKASITSLVSLKDGSLCSSGGNVVKWWV